MTTKIHSMIINPGVTMTYVCEDGLTSLEKYHIAEILNFDGHLQPENCGPAQEYITLFQAWGDMLQRANDTPKGQAKNDFYLAADKNEDAENKFEGTDLYNKWIGQRNNEESHEFRFQTLI